MSHHRPDSAHFISCGDTDTVFRSQSDSVSWQQQWWANPVLLQQMSASSAARTDPGTAALQRVIISRVNPRCSALTSRVQLTAVINYPLCSNRNRFPGVLLVRMEILQDSHWPISAHQRATHTREKIRGKIWRWKLAETNWIILNFTIEIKVADNNTTYIIHGVSPTSV